MVSCEKYRLINIINKTQTDVSDMVTWVIDVLNLAYSVHKIGL